ncbi:hypothetical protein M406DRAFT_334642 [Cryphonectria parasitica EP155]|uniref:Uncharacterized protein n=1 Tax=Cryphonectria parasitica (strain ATCC 38755 / EP155) TaxID=660469 RepID=A0A9P5CJG4_CRYP1|nr:uncharacterized protein M406DRAFT_334642 [Cryphonectria parasitica EP155]KAF3761028.1 hypothetical protein M406DRAFT_334642 [Cryphonectria parasitica EP155]
MSEGDYARGPHNPFGIEVATADEDEDDGIQLSADTWTSLASPTPFARQSEHQRQRSPETLPEPDDLAGSCACLGTSPSPHESTTSIDAIALALSRQRLRLDACSSPPRPDVRASDDELGPAPQSTTTAVVPLEVDQAYQGPSASSEIRPFNVPSVSAAVVEKAAGPLSDEDSFELRASIADNNRRLRRRMSSRFHTIGQNSRETKGVEEGDMTRCRTQYGARPSLSSGTDVIRTLNFGENMEVDSPSLEVDEHASRDTESVRQSIEEYLATRRQNAAIGFDSSGQPLYRSSTETALRCRNLVKNKPRMRKRTKLRDKPSNAAIPAAASLGPTSTPTTQ